MTPNRKTRLLQASIQLAERATNTTWQARHMAQSEKETKFLMTRATRQQTGAFRMLRWAGVA